jgi:hypothetical protein
MLPLGALLSRRPREPSRLRAARAGALLAFQSIGIIYGLGRRREPGAGRRGARSRREGAPRPAGDLATSVVYTYPSLFDGPPAQADVYGTLSLVFWSLNLASAPGPRRAARAHAR